MYQGEAGDGRSKARATYSAHETRVSWSSQAGGDRAVDGGWWPRTDRLEVEFGGLAGLVVTRLRDQIAHVQANVVDWVEQPLAIDIREQQVPVSWFTILFEHLVVVHCASGRRLMLVVIAPDTEVAVALRALDLAGDPETASLGDEILTAASTEDIGSIGPAVALRRLGYRIRSRWQT